MFVTSNVRDVFGARSAGDVAGASCPYSPSVWQLRGTTLLFLPRQPLLRWTVPVLSREGTRPNAQARADGWLLTAVSSAG